MYASLHIIIYGQNIHTYVHSNNGVKQYPGRL